MIGQNEFLTGVTLNGNKDQSPSLSFSQYLRAEIKFRTNSKRPSYDGLFITETFVKTFFLWYNKKI